MGARIRTIKPEFWNDEKLGKLPREVRLTFLGIISSMADAQLELDLFPTRSIPIPELPSAPKKSRLREESFAPKRGKRRG
jgi:hypothetical protein